MIAKSLKRLLSIVLVVTMLTSVMVIPAEAVENVNTDVKFCFTTDTGAALGDNIAAGTLVHATLNATADVTYTTFQLAYAVDSSKLELQQTVKDLSAFGMGVFTHWADGPDFMQLQDNYVSSSDANIKVLRLSFAGNSAKTWSSAAPIITLKFIALSDMTLAELTQAVTIEAQNSTTGETCYGVTQCMSYFADRTPNANKDYTANFITCPALVVTPPTETVYVNDSMADIADKVTAQYIDAAGNAQNVSVSVSVKDGGNLSVGENTLVATYRGYTAEFEVTAAAVEIVGITATAPTKMAYKSGETLDLTGLTVTADYNNGPDAEIADYDVYLGIDKLDLENLPVLKVADNGKELKVVSANDKTAVVGNIEVAANGVEIPTVKGTYEYTDEQQTVQLNSFDDKTMEIVSGNQATNAGTYTLVIKLKNPTEDAWVGGNDPIELPWTIAPKPLSDADFTFADQEYTGAAIEVEPTTVLKAADYQIGEYENNINVGTATVTITGKGNYTGTVTETFEITAKAITPTVTLTLPEGGYVYDGNAKEPAVTVTYDGQPLDPETYSVNYADNTNAGENTAKVAVTSSKGNYSFDVEKTFSIKKADQTISGDAFSVKAGGATVGLSTKFTAEGDLSFAITGGNATGSTVSGDVLTPGTNLGSFTLTVTAAETGNYKEATQTFTIQVVEKPSHALTSFENPTLSCTYGDSPAAQTVTSSTGTVVYSSSDADAVSVDADTGALTIHKITDGVTITATVAGNAEYAEATASYVVKVAAKELEITGLGATNRAYEAGNVNVTLTGGTLTGMVGSDDVTCEIPTTGTVENANAGNGKVVSVVKPDLTGTAAGNYTLKDLPQITVDIAQATPDVGTVSRENDADLYESTALADIALTKTGSASGTLALDNGQVLIVGTNSYNWTFTPNDATNYKTVKGTISLTVLEDTLQSIAVTGTLAKTAYKYGEAFETDGLTVTATYASGANKDVTKDVTSGALSVGQTSVELSYGGKTCTVDGITVDKADGPAAPTVDGEVSDNAEQTKFIYTVTPVEGAEYKMDGGNWQDSNVFENIAPDSTHSFSVRVKETENVKAGAEGTKEVLFSKMDNSNVPTLNYKVTGNVGDRTITVTPVEGAEYSFDGGQTWGAENTKTGLGDTTVDVQIRYAETDTRNASTAATATVNTAKQVQAVLTITSGTNVTYGKTLTLSTSGGSGTGAVTYTVTGGTGKATVSGNVLTATQAGTVTVVATKAEDATYDSATSAAVTITIAKATPTGEPAFTKVTDSGKTLADAALNVGTINVPGTIVWDDGDATKVEANKEYTWTFTPDDTTNYEILTGSIKVWTRNSGGSSVTFYKVNEVSSKHGSVSFRPGKTSAGSQVVITVNPDEGYELDELIVTDTKGKEIPVSKNKQGNYVFKMPAGNVFVEAVFEKIEEEVEVSFSDVNEDAYYFDAVEWAVQNGVTTGYANGTFLPNNTCTRAQTVTFLWRAMGSPEPESSYMPFADVDEDAYYYDAVLWALENGITTGVTATTFAPNKTVSRAQTVTFLWRTARINGYDVSAGEDTNILSYEDALTIPEYAISALQWACGDGILGGYADGTLRPNAGCTRAHIVTFLYRFLAE